MPRITFFIVLIFTLTWLTLISPSQASAALGDWCNTPISYGSNTCCNEVGGTWTPQPNNVCNPVQQMQLDADGDCVLGPYTRWSYPHSCDLKPECCYASSTPTATPVPPTDIPPTDVPPTGVAACDPLVGNPCRYRNSDGSYTTNNSCCHRQCSGVNCITVFGSGNQGCSVNASPSSECTTATATPVPTATPIPIPVISNQQANCLNDGLTNRGQLAYLTWTTTPAGRSGVKVRVATGSYPGTWQDTTTDSWEWSTVAGNSYYWKVVACNSVPVCNCEIGGRPPCQEYPFTCPATPVTPTPTPTPTASPTPTRTPTPTPTTIPGAPVLQPVTVPICSTSSSYQATLNWSGTPYDTGPTNCNMGFWVDIDNDSNWGNGYYHKCVTTTSTTVTTTSTTAPAGFGAYPTGSGTLTLQPDTRYYARVYNGRQGNTQSFSSPTCTTSPTPASAPGRPTVISTCTTTSGITSGTLTISNKPAGTDHYQITINGAIISSNVTAATDPVNYTPPAGSVVNGYPWGVQACNAANSCGNSATGIFTCTSNTTPWIFVDGDVHSNTRIYTPGGPP